MGKTLGATGFFKIQIGETLLGPSRPSRCWRRILLFGFDGTFPCRAGNPLRLADMLRFWRVANSSFRLSADVD